jgi:nitrate/nitrite transport system substrate-binding protein
MPAELARPLQYTDCRKGERPECWRVLMAEFKHPYEPQHPGQEPGCICGRHRSPLEHEHEARTLQCVPVESEPRRYDGLIASKTLRVNFPKN